MGDYKLALQIYLEFISDKGNVDPKIQLRIAKCYIKLRERKQALLYLESSLTSKSLDLKPPEKLSLLINGLDLAFNRL